MAALSESALPAWRRPRTDLHPCARDALDMIALNGIPYRLELGDRYHSRRETTDELWTQIFTQQSFSFAAGNARLECLNAMVSINISLQLAFFIYHGELKVQTLL